MAPGDGTGRSARRRRRPPPEAVRALLGCGIAYPVAYVVLNDVVAAPRYPGYRRADRAISELSATGAPTRRFLVAMLPVLTVLTLCFGAGVWWAAEGRRGLRATGGVLLASGVTGVAWLPFPMSSREDIARGAGTSSDVGHLVLSGLTTAEILALFATASTAFGSRFRTYSLLSALTMLASGAMTTAGAASLSAGSPTPRLGIHERTMLAPWLLWQAVLAGMLLREQRRARHAGVTR